MRERLQEKFSQIDWAKGTKDGPRSGPGSTLEFTAPLRTALPDLLDRLSVRRFIDAPCGDWHWMQHVDLGQIDYVGIDIVEEIITENTRSFTGPRVHFQVSDITNDPLPAGDLLMCRDCLFHLKYWLRWAFFENFLASEIPYLLTTVHDAPTNRNVPENGKFRWFNPRIAPFNLPEPLELLPDHPALSAGEVQEDWRNRRYLGLWSRDQVAAALAART